MNNGSTAIRIVRDEPEDTPTPPVRLAGADAGLSLEAALDRIDELQAQLQVMQAELNAHRQRDERLHFEMHRLDEELRLAARIQRDFLPKELPEVGKVRFSTLFRPAGYVSGDIYDVMRLDEHHVGFYVADAVGHGMPAALLTMFIKRAMIIKEIGKNGYRLLKPSESLSHLNQALLDQNLSQATFATAMCGMINVQTFTVQFACGGHPSPLLLRPDGSLCSIDAQGGLLGIFDNERFTDHTVNLEAGDRLLLFSDGIETAFSESTAVDGDVWRNQVRRLAHLPTDALLRELHSILDSQNGSLMPKDDLTLVILETVGQ
jgi:sigma-B regulation protein RsbU (phosphoserine phosphatase)